MSHHIRALSRRRAALGACAGAVLVVTALGPQAASPAAGDPPGRTAGAGVAAVRSTPSGAAPGPGASDPTVSLRTSSFLGGRDWDEGGDVEVDATGATYIAGFTLSADFPTRRAAQGRFGGLSDAFLTKVAPDGRSVLWSTYLGGVDVDVAQSLALDAAGNVYVTGRTASPDFPTTRGAFQTRLRGTLCQDTEPCHDAFVTKLSPDGRVVYSTLLGGTANDEGVGIAVDRNGGAWVTGNTDSTDLPVRRAVQDGFQSPPCPGDLPCEYDVFVSRLTEDGRRLSFSSYLGGDASDTAGGIAVDAAGSAYVTGTTRSADFPVTPRARQRSITGLACGPPPGVPCLDAFVTKITKRELAYSTYVGGTRDERSSGIAVDRSGRAVITGSTRSTDLPLAQPVQQRIDNASCTTELPEEQCDDAFVTQLTDDGRALVFSTYLGGQAEDQGLAVTVDSGGNSVVAGRTDSRDFPVLRAAPPAQPAFGGYIDGFATKLASGTGALLWSTFVGGSKADRVTGIDTHTGGSVHLTGRTLSPDFATERPFQPRMGKDDDYDAFLRTLQ